MTHEQDCEKYTALSQNLESMQMTNAAMGKKLLAQQNTLRKVRV